MADKARLPVNRCCVYIYPLLSCFIFLYSNAIGCARPTRLRTKAAHAAPAPRPRKQGRAQVGLCAATARRQRELDVAAHSADYTVLL